MIFSLSVRQLGGKIRLLQEKILQVFRSMSTWSRDVIDANFLQLLVVVIRSLSYDAALILVYAFVTRRIDYCYSAIAGRPFCIRERLHR